MWLILMTSPSAGNRATLSDLLDAATKLDHLADEIEKTGHTIGGAAAAAAAANFGFSLSASSIATCGHLNSSIAHTVADLRNQSRQLRQTAATYTDLDSQSETDVTVA